MELRQSGSDLPTNAWKSKVQAVAQHDDMSIEAAPLLRVGPDPLETEKLPVCNEINFEPSGTFQRLRSAGWESGTACVAGAALLFSLTGALVKVINAGGQGVPVFQVVVIRSLLSMLLTLVTAAVRRTPMRSVYGQLRHWPLLGARGLVGAAAMTLFYESLIRLPLGDAMTIMFCNPAICSVLAWVLLGEAFGLLTVLGCLASMAGVALVARPPFLFGEALAAGGEWTRDRTVGMVFAVAGAFVSSGALLAIRVIGKREPPIVVAMWFHTTALASNAIPLACAYPRAAVLPGPLESVFLLAIGLCSFTAQLLLNRGFQIQLAVKAAAVNYTQVIYAHIFGAAFFQESITLLGILGSMLIAVGVLTVNADNKSCSQSQPRVAPGGTIRSSNADNGRSSVQGVGGHPEMHTAGQAVSSPWEAKVSSQQRHGKSDAGPVEEERIASLALGTTAHRPWLDKYGKLKLKSSAKQLQVSPQSQGHSPVRQDERHETGHETEALEICTNNARSDQGGGQDRGHIPRVGGTLPSRQRHRNETQPYGL